MNTSMMIQPFPNFHALRHIWFSLHAGFVLPDEEKSGEDGQRLRVNVQRPGPFWEGSNTQLLQEGVLWMTRCKKKLFSPAITFYL